MTTITTDRRDRPISSNPPKPTALARGERPSTTTLVSTAIAEEGARAPVYVYEWPLRLWHWVTALDMVALSVTGYLIAKPVDGLGTGWVRLIHFAGGELLAVAFVLRVYWAFVGNHHARTLFYLPVWKKAFLLEVIEEVKWYTFLRKRPHQYVGHNPLARIGMCTMFLLPLIFMIVSGFALYGEDSPGGVFSTLFGWVFAFGSSQTIRTWHHLGMWMLAIFSCVHIYLCIREDIMGRTTIVSSMIGGWRGFKE